MTLDKAIEYLDIVLKSHPRLRPGDFGQAVNLGREALKCIKKHRAEFGNIPYTGLPGEDPQ